MATSASNAIYLQGSASNLQPSDVIKTVNVLAHQTPFQIISTSSHPSAVILIPVNGKSHSNGFMTRSYNQLLASLACGVD